MRMPEIKATQTLPAILAVTGMKDYGPSDGEGSACCPHCGARGRYIWYFICEDGSKRGAMRGCIQLFPRKSSRNDKLIQEAFERLNKAREENKNPASWWLDMVKAAEEFASLFPLEDHNAINSAYRELHNKVQDAENRRQDWLRKNGYGKYTSKPRRNSYYR